MLSAVLLVSILVRAHNSLVRAFAVRFPARSGEVGVNRLAVHVRQSLILVRGAGDVLPIQDGASILRGPSHPTQQPCGLGGLGTAGFPPQAEPGQCLVKAEVEFTLNDVNLARVMVNEVVFLQSEVLLAGPLNDEVDG